ncbi:hypothetical protein AB4116_03745, partial [Vibrio splendidus]
MRNCLLILVFLFGFTNAANASLTSGRYYKISISNKWTNTLVTCGLSSGDVFQWTPSFCSGQGWTYGGKDYTSTYSTGCGYKDSALCISNGSKAVQVGGISRAVSCPAGKTLNEETGQCESPCKQMEGNQLGLVAFPEGSSLVSAVCRNSCKATLASGTWVKGGIQNDPRPFGLYDYSGESCDGSESSGGETGG